MLDSIRIDIQNRLRTGFTFDYVLKKNPDLYIKNLENIEYKDHWFEYLAEDIEFIGIPIIYEISDRSDDKFYVYISDFDFKGKLCYSDFLSNEKQIDIKLSATLRVYKNQEFDIQLTNDNNHIEVWDTNQKNINFFNSSAHKMLEGFDLISNPFNYGKFSEVINKIDSTDINSPNQFHVSSLFYLQEVIECYERIKDLLSFVLLNSKYSNNYTRMKWSLPPVYNDLYHFPIDLNFKIYDRYYLMFSELTFESLYKFWERISFYIFQFFKPMSNKVTDDNLSLKMLVSELNKEKGVNKCLQNIHFEWFDKFVLDVNSDFKKLTNYRHPLIHYKFDKSTGKSNGSLIAKTSNEWHDNKGDKNALDNIATENANIQLFLIEQFKYCKIGYDHMLELCKTLPDQNK